MPLSQKAFNLVVFIGLIGCLVVGSSVGAQTVPTGTAEPGSPPNITLIDISAPDADGFVTITGAPGTVFPNARIAIRNLYTEETRYLETGVSGGFTTRLFGPGNTPFWFSPTRSSVPREQQNIPGSLPGGPGTIIYGPFPENRAATEPVTQILLDGGLSDWAAYPGTAAPDGDTFLLRNRDSLYLAGADLRTDAAQLTVLFTINNATYQLNLTLPADGPPPQVGQLSRIAPDERDLGLLPVDFAVSDTAFELRLYLLDIRNDSMTASLRQYRVLGTDSDELAVRVVEQDFPPVDETDGIVHLESQLPADPIRFTVGGVVGDGAGFWSARGRIDRLELTDLSEPLALELDVELVAPDLAEDAFDLTPGGQIALQPVVARTGRDLTAIPGSGTNNGWSNLQTPGGLAIDNLSSAIVIGTATTDPAQVLRRGDRLQFALNFTLELPPDLPDGLYVPVFTGLAALGDTQVTWAEAGLFGSGPGTSAVARTRLPLVLERRVDTPAPLPWTLFHDQPSDGSRGILPEADRDRYTLSNRVRFNSPTYILPPPPPESGYSIEPYLLNMLPNAYASSAAPLVPFLFPGGRLNARIERPDGSVEDLGSAPILQNRVSTEAVDEAERFGEQAPLDAYQLTTLNPLFTAYPFTDYGAYTITLTGSIEDVWGNRYEGGGMYHLLIAEPLDMNPGLLPGTPVEVGDAFSPVLSIAPGVPAEVTITLRVFPLDGGEPRENILVGQANRYGYYHSREEVIRFTEPGEYVVEYEARYTDQTGRLWAGSLRAAGLVATPDATLIAHGERGLDGVEADITPAWYDAERYVAVIGADDTALRPNMPYHAGDVAWLGEGRADGLFPVIRVQDVTGDYADWLLNAVPGLADANRRDALPVTLLNDDDTPFAPALDPAAIVNDAYTYISAVRPGLTLRQFVAGGDGDLPLRLSMDDRYNQQIGAGLTGERPGDYIFLFGGAVVRNEAADISDTAIYAALATVIDPELDPGGPRVLPPFRGQTGGGDGGPLLFIRQEPREMFFTPTALQPGQILTAGDTLSLAGQVGPTLPATVDVTITAPSGTVRQFSGRANRIGYFYQPETDLIVDEIGVWRVEITTRYAGLTSAGLIDPEQPLPVGTVPGTEGAGFSVYVVPPDAQPIPWDRGADFTFPAASPFNFAFNVPEGWTNVSAFATLTMPGFVISDEPLAVTGRTIGFQYNPAAINFEFPNWELVGGVPGAFVSDPLYLSVVITGTDVDGRFRVRPRTFTLFHERMLSLE